MNFISEMKRLASMVKSQFDSRTITQSRRTGQDFKGALMTTEISNNILNINIATEDSNHSLTVPIPYVKNNVVLIKNNEIERAVCNYFDVKSDRIIPYTSVMYEIFMGDFSSFVKEVKKKKIMFVQQLAYSVVNNNLPIIVYNLQKAINEVVNKMPLHETDMLSYVMNNRLMMIDDDFDKLFNPEHKLAYQIDKNRAYFNRGWTSIGLSDGTLADKNYILTGDIRKFTPFGFKYHNPQRNLYSTLCMKGDEDQKIRTESYQALIDKGTKRKGWNWFTAYVDVPDTFEDQILVDKRHANKYITSYRRIFCYGEVLVNVGQSLKFGDKISSTNDGKVSRYDVRADHTKVVGIRSENVVIGGKNKQAWSVKVRIRRNLKDGTKITNTHGNKGVIRLMDLGYATDPVTGEKRNIDVIVSAKTIPKRENFGQLMEAFANDIFERTGKSKKVYKTKSSWNSFDQSVGVTTSYEYEKEHRVIPDDFDPGENSFKEKLMSMGFNEDLSWECNTYVGKVTACCGSVFWGVSKEAEDQLWEDGDTERRNNQDLRTAGLKLSTVEFKALETNFGKDNALIREILSYTQGSDIIAEKIRVLKSKLGEFPENTQVVNVQDIKTIDQINGTMFDEDEIKGTIADEKFFENGFLINLPLPYQTVVGVDPKMVHEGGVILFDGCFNPELYKRIHLTDKLYVPYGVLRRCWRHGSGMYGMNPITTMINTVVVMAKRYLENPEESINISMYYMAIKSYFDRVLSSVVGKSGDINNYSLSVRYPMSAKAVATLNSKLPEHTVQIHKNMAKILEVKEGDYVLVERFPCLGFMGLRSQKVTITDDPMCKYTIRVSGNSLVSQNLDFDGDVIYLASFKTEEANKLLENEWKNPNPAYWRHVDWLNNRKGSPTINSFGFNDYKVKPFEDLNVESHSTIISKSTGVKALTGPMMAMAYNLMRITETVGEGVDQYMQTDIEMFIEKAGQSVFEQKHGGVSLHEIVIDAICTGDVGLLIKNGFNEEVSKFICNVIKMKAISLGVNDLISYHIKAKATGGSNIVSKIVKNENKLYFASRSNIDLFKLFNTIKGVSVDLPSRIFKLTTFDKFEQGENYYGY
jgi:hypothetical protein